MAYKVIITPPAKRRLDMYIGYTALTLKNKQGAKAIEDDARETKKRLSKCADAIAYCTNEILAAHGYRKFMFKEHDFFMVYRIDGSNVIVEGMFHELQDFESIFIREMCLK